MYTHRCRRHNIIIYLLTSVDELSDLLSCLRVDFVPVTREEGHLDEDEPAVGVLEKFDHCRV